MSQPIKFQDFYQRQDNKPYTKVIFQSIWHTFFPINQVLLPCAVTQNSQWDWFSYLVLLHRMLHRTASEIGSLSLCCHTEQPVRLVLLPCAVTQSSHEIGSITLCCHTERPVRLAILPCAVTQNSQWDWFSFLVLSHRTASEIGSLTLCSHTERPVRLVPLPCAATQSSHEIGSLTLCCHIEQPMAAGTGTGQDSQKLQKNKEVNQIHRNEDWIQWHKIVSVCMWANSFVGKHIKFFFIFFHQIQTVFSKSIWLKLQLPSKIHVTIHSTIYNQKFPPCVGVGKTLKILIGPCLSDITSWASPLVWESKLRDTCTERIFI